MVMALPFVLHDGQDRHHGRLRNDEANGPAASATHAALPATTIGPRRGVCARGGPDHEGIKS
jgi:hypothetical protein